MKAFFLGAILSLACQGAVMDFQSLQTADNGHLPRLQTYAEDGFVLSPGGGQFAWWGTSSYGYYPGSTALVNNYTGQITSLTRADGGAFSLVSIDMAKLFPWTQVAQMHFHGTRSDGSTIGADFTANTSSPLPTLSTFAFGAGWTDLERVDWIDVQVGTSFSYIQFDNIVVNASEAPEPATMAVISAGLSLLAAARRRRR